MGKPDSKSALAWTLRIAGWLLLLVHTFLMVWALGGLLELFLPKVFWKPFSNLQFPAWLLLIHWLSVLFAAGIFMGGFFRRWPATPFWMAWAYLAMAGVCALETFGFMTEENKYWAMAGEYSVYTCIILLLRSEKFRELHFGLKNR